MTRRSDGSVLMETVLVLPLLLLMLGGLFILGDIAHGRLHLGTVDRAVAWSSANRFSEPSFRSWFAYVPETSALRVERVRAGELDASTNAPALRGNRWLGVYAGYANARVDVPFWVGMANAHANLFRRPDDERLPSSWTLFPNEEESDETDESDESDDEGERSAYRELGRSFVVHRRNVAAVSNALYRAQPVQNLSWQSVVGDDWCGLAPARGLAGSPPGTGFRRHPFALFVGE